jgi:hypothetical protein
VNRTYANSPVLACGSTRQHTPGCGSSDAPVRSRDAPAAEGQSMRNKTPDRLASEVPLRPVDLARASTGADRLSGRRSVHVHPRPPGRFGWTATRGSVKLWHGRRPRSNQ